MSKAVVHCQLAQVICSHIILCQGFSGALHLPSAKKKVRGRQATAANDSRRHWCCDCSARRALREANAGDKRNVETNRTANGPGTWAPITPQCSTCSDYFITVRPKILQGFRCNLQAEGVPGAQLFWMPMGFKRMLQAYGECHLFRDALSH